MTGLAPMTTPRLSATDWGRLALLSVVWGGSFFFVEVALTALPPLSLASLRVALAAALLWIVALALGAPTPARRIWLPLLALGLLNNAVPFALIAYGQSLIASGLASILNATTPVFAVIVAGLALKDEPITAAKSAGVLVGLVGAATAIGPAALAGVGDAAVIGQLAVLAAAVSYAVAGAHARGAWRRGAPPLAIAAGQLTASTLLLTPVALWVERPWIAIAAAAPEDLWIAAAAMVGLASLSTAYAYLLYFRIVAAAGAVNVLLVTLLIPISAILLGAIVLGERLEPRHFAGMALIGFGLSLIDGRLWRRGGALRRQRY